MARGTRATEPVLDIHDIQGNVLTAFNKDHQRLIALRLRSIPDARRWLRRILPHINSLAEVNQFNALYRMQRARLGHTPHGLAATWMNLAFSHGGIAQLTSDTDADLLPDPSVVAGLGKERAAFIGDPAPPGGSDPTVNWVVGGTNHPVDIFMILAGDDDTALKSMVERLRPGPHDGAAAPEAVWEEQGDARRDLPGHEHFGFKDGISQPGVRGLLSKRPKVYLTERRLKPPPPGTIEFAKPGQPLIWPGHFVLGYPFGNRNDGSRQNAEPLARRWFRNGSFLVFRRLQQNVAAFGAFVAAEAARLALLPGFGGITPEHLGALMVGRWPSGAPISRAPDNDNLDLAKDPLSNNDFLFSTDTPAPAFLPGGGMTAGNFSRAMEGSNGPVCPHAGHIFKVNPRDFATNIGPDFDTLTRRILRRGIPFGPALSKPLDGDDGVSRGLHFICYQVSIAEQFEKLQQNWANNNGAPATGGHDLIIGQTSTGVRSMDLAAIVPSQPGETTTAPIQWVTPTGGGYFFAPSIHAIRDVICPE